MLRQRILLSVLIMVLLVAGCHRRTVPSSSQDILSTGSEIGYASYYSDRFNGLTTANGEIYQSSKLTAAHRKLPFGAIVTVTNLSNEKSVKVRINDRGPFVDGRIIDLSKAAAKKLDMINAGVVKVWIRYRE